MTSEVVSISSRLVYSFTQSNPQPDALAFSLVYHVIVSAIMMDPEYDFDDFTCLSLEIELEEDVPVSFTLVSVICICLRNLS